MKGVDQNIDFILNEDVIILNVKNNIIEETDLKLLKGTIVKGSLKTRVLKLENEKVPVKIIQLQNKEGYISPESVNLYIGDFANLDAANKSSDNTPVRDTALGESVSKKKTLKNKAIKFTVNYGLPIVGGVAGYQIAKKTGITEKGKLIGYVLFFMIVGSIPRFLRKKKEK